MSTTFQSVKKSLTVVLIVSAASHATWAKGGPGGGGGGARSFSGPSMGSMRVSSNSFQPMKTSFVNQNFTANRFSKNNNFTSNLGIKSKISDAVVHGNLS